MNDTSTTEIYTLSLHDALPILMNLSVPYNYLYRKEKGETEVPPFDRLVSPTLIIDRKSTRLNSSHGYISYAVFCLKKKKTVAEKLRVRRLA